MRSAKCGVRGARVVRVLLLAVLATAVMPPAAAWWLNHRRITLTQSRADAAVVSVSAPDAAIVLCGPGRLPDLDVAGAGSVHAAWLTSAVTAPDVFGAGMPTDAWGRCFLLNDRWLLSAGPNGAIETPFDATALHGDDVGVRR